MTTFRVMFPATELDVNGVWPDGDGPENPTAEDVVKVMRECGAFKVLNEWNLIDRIIVEGPGGVVAEF